MSSPYATRLAELRAEPKTWLVTGAAGFIGSHLCETLLANDQHVVGLDNFATGSRENLALLEQAFATSQRFKRFRLIVGDVSDVSVCMRAIDRVDFVLHQAALGSVPRSIVRPIETHRANVDGTLNVFLAALQSHVPRIVYASSSSVYGDEPNLPKIEARIGEPLSPYAASKRIGEIYAAVLGRTHGLYAVGLRYFNVIGARQDPDGPYAAVLPRFAAMLARGERPEIFGDGESSRDFCPVANVVQANILAAMAKPECAGRAYNVALGSQTTINQLFALLRAGMAERGFPCESIEPSYRSFRQGDVRHSLADISAAERDLGYRPEVELASGIASALDFFAAAARKRASA